MVVKKFNEKKKQISRFSCQDTQNGVKRPEKEFRKTSEWMYVRACVKTSKNSNVCILGITGNYSADRIEIWYRGNPNVSLSSV